MLTIHSVGLPALAISVDRERSPQKIRTPSNLHKYSNSLRNNDTQCQDFQKPCSLHTSEAPAVVQLNSTVHRCSQK